MRASLGTMDGMEQYTVNPYGFNAERQNPDTNTKMLHRMRVVCSSIAFGSVWGFCLSLIRYVSWAGTTYREINYPQVYIDSMLQLHSTMMWFFAANILVFSASYVVLWYKS